MSSVWMKSEKPMNGFTFPWHPQKGWCLSQEWTLCHFSKYKKVIIIIFCWLLEMITHFVCFIFGPLFLVYFLLFFLEGLIVFFFLFFFFGMTCLNPILNSFSSSQLCHLFSPETILLELSAFLLQTGQLLARFPAAFFFFLLYFLLRYNWFITLYNFKVYNVLIWSNFIYIYIYLISKTCITEKKICNH